MNRRDLIRFVDINEEAEDAEGTFGFFTDDVTEELKYK